MELRLLWFVLAGFILGFATSMLWEWLYFRRRRLAVGLYSTPALHQAPPTPYTLIGEEQSPSAVPGADYRSPGVFLDSEQLTSIAVDTSRRDDTTLVNPSSLPAKPDPIPAIYVLKPVAPSATPVGSQAGEHEQDQA